MSNNLRYYSAFRTPPAEALKPIPAGRLKGKTDINPMWRIQALTEQFGPCGIGWRYTIDRQWLEQGAGAEIAAFCNISLYIKTEEGWSEGIPGTGGSMLAAQEKNGPYTNDEAYKMALTDALSVACKALGVGADIYWQNDPTKYGRQPAPSKPEPPKAIHCEVCGNEIKGRRNHETGEVILAEELAERSRKKYEKVLCVACAKAMDAPYPPPVV